jgi:hypothetical protein
MGNFGKALDLRRSGVPGGLGHLYRRVYRPHQLVRECRQHFDVFSCVVDRMFHSLFQKIHLDRRSLFDVLHFAKLFDVLNVAIKRFLGHLRDLAGESLDRFDRRGHCLERDILYRAIVRVGGFCPRALFSLERRTLS